MSDTENIAARLANLARTFPETNAVIKCRRDRSGLMHYDAITYRELDQTSDQLARGLVAMGVCPGMRIVLMVPPGRELFALTYAVYRAGATLVLIDPGMGRTRIFDCLEEINPDGFIGIPLVQIVRLLSRKRFPNARHNVTVGRRLCWGGKTYRQLLNEDHSQVALPRVVGTDPAAIIFTSGSTGPPKGVLYEHGMFNAQIDLLREFFGIQPGEVDLAAFPLFALIDASMGVTSVIPDMNPTRPADVRPENVLEPIRHFQISQAFGSPALWNRIGKHCVENNLTIPHLRRIISAGAPLPLPILRRMHTVLETSDADMFPPYGATESLPVACLSGRQMVGDIGERTARGAGTCVGTIFPGMTARIIEISHAAVERPSDMKFLPNGAIGEICVRGPVVTREYYNRPGATKLAKIADENELWHRMGDVGYLDEEGRLWFCGRKAHIVWTTAGPLFTEQCEPIFNEHPRVYRTALVGIGEVGQQIPAIVVEPEPGELPTTKDEQRQLIAELREMALTQSHTRQIATFLFHPSLPVDIRHNVKINREELARWATASFKGRSG